MATKNLIVKNVPYGGVRAVIQGSQSSQAYTYYSEGRGDRYYVNSVNATASSQMESATFQSFLSFTMSGAVNYSFDLVPMDKGQSVVLDTVIYAQNIYGTKAFVTKQFGAYRHSGATLSVVGGGLDITTKTDFTNVSATFSTFGTQSIRLTVSGQSSETIDFDVHINYTKGYHTSLTASSGGRDVIYPEAQSS